MKTCRMYIVRHGQSTHNRDGIISGYTADPELTQEGIQQAQQTLAKLAHVTFDEVYSSDLKRALDTAVIVSGKPVPNDHQIPGLRERKFGAFDGKPNHHFNDLRAESKLKKTSHEERWNDKLADDMESDREVAQRFEAALIKIAKQNLGKTILVATHGGTLRTLLIHLGYARSEELQYGSIDNAAYAELLYKDSKITFGEMSGIRKTDVAT